MEGRRLMTVCEALSFSGAEWNLVIEKGPFGPSFLAFVDKLIKPFVFLRGVTSHGTGSESQCLVKPGSVLQ